MLQGHSLSSLKFNGNVLKLSLVELSSTVAVLDFGSYYQHEKRQINLSKSVLQLVLLSSLRAGSQVIIPHFHFLYGNHEVKYSKC